MGTRELDGKDNSEKEETTLMSLVGWRTVIVAALIAAVGALQGLDWVHLIPNDPQAVGWVITGLGIVMAILRTLSTTPVGKSV